MNLIQILKKPDLRKIHIAFFYVFILFVEVLTLNAISPDSDDVNRNQLQFTTLSTVLPVCQLTAEGLQIRQAARITDNSHTLTIEQVIERFSNGQSELFHFEQLHNFGVGDLDQWFAIRVNKATQFKEPNYLFFDGNNPDKVTVWSMRLINSILHTDRNSAGGLVPFSHRALQINAISLPIRLSENADTVLIWHVRNSGPNLFAIWLSPQSTINELLSSRSMIEMILIGSLGAFVIFCIFLFVAVRDRAYLFFMLQLAGTSIYLFCLHGYGIMLLWHDQPIFDKLVGSCAILLGLMATIQFVRMILTTKQVMPIMDRWLLLQIGLIGIGLILEIINFNIGIMVGMFVIASTLISVEVAIIKHMRSTEPSNNLFFIAWTILVISYALCAAANIGVQLPGTAMFLMFRAEHLGFFIEAIIITFILSQRIRNLRIQKEEAETKNRLKQEFIAVISHEMRTPLNGIIGFAESVEQSNVIHDIKLYNQKILHESELLLNQINQLLVLAKIEAGRLDIESNTFRLDKSIATISEVFRLKAEAKGLEYTCTLDPDTPMLIIGDRIRLEQVLHNLIDNAIKFTHAGKVNVEVSTHMRHPTMAIFRFEINDTGIGIPADKINSIMDDFVQADTGITRRFGGTGIGTSLARRIVEAMHGHIKVESTVGIGTRFLVYLPFAIAAEHEKLIEHVIPETQQIQNKMPETITSTPIHNRILIVDDLETNRQVLRIHLRNIPFTIDEAENAESALELTDAYAYDVIFMDIFMPGISGHDATRAIRTRQLNRNTPIIAVTASGFEEDRQAAKAAGMNDILIKPIKRNDILNMLSTYVQNQSL